MSSQNERETYTFTITATLDAESGDKAWDQWVALLAEPRLVEEFTVVASPAATDPDQVWASLSPAAKATWVRAMMPPPA